MDNSTGGPESHPIDTFRVLGRQLSPVTGIVSSLKRVSNTDEPVSIYLATMSPPFVENFGMSWQRHLAGGKGWTDVEARTSALCEALERHSSYVQGYEPRVHASLDSLGKAAIHPNQCMLFSNRQFEQRERLNSSASRFGFIPEQFDPSCELDWAPVWSVTREEWRYVPAQYCYRNYPAADDRTFCRADSNGTAAGETVRDAITRGFLELVERDAVAVWWYNRLRRPRIDLSQSADPPIRDLQRFYRERGREFWVLDLTNDLEVPACVAISKILDGPEEGLIMGFAAAFDPMTALRHALAEMTQLLLPASRWLSMEESELGGVDPVLLQWLRTATIDSQPHLAPATTSPLWGIQSFREITDLHQLTLEIVQQHGLELLALDLTRPDIGLPVTKVIVPGLRHFWPRFAPGRLYDVPVELGWLSKPLSEDELNPWPLFF
jgi:ribosomal protein S12 methylthiotransferase accessory factor